MRQALIWAAVTSLLVAGLVAANLGREPRFIDVDWQLFRPSPPVVSIGHPTAGTITRTIAAKGVVEPTHEAEVIAKVTGKVAAVLVEEGSSVEQGDILVRLDATTFRKRADIARSRLDTATANLKQAEAHLRDIEKDPAAATTPANVATPVNPLAGHPGAPVPPPAVGPTKLEAARDSVTGWTRERDSSLTADEQARTDLDRCSIRAPIDGVVEELAVAVGDDVSAGPTVSLASNSTPTASASLFGGIGLGPTLPDPRSALPTGPARTLCRLLDPKRLRVRAWIDEADVGLVTADQVARIFLPDEPTIPVSGRIEKVAARGRPNGDVVSYAATIDLLDSGRQARAGMRVNVEVEVSRQETSLGVPVQAVVHRKKRDISPMLSSRSGDSTGDDASYVKAVFVLDGAQVRLRPIETGVSDERQVEVVSGLESGERLVVGPFRALDTLEDGFVVRTEATPELVPGLTSRGRGPTR